MACLILSLATLASTALAHSHAGHAGHDHVARNWPSTFGEDSIPDDHPVYRLFKRQAAAGNYPTVDVPGPVPQAAWVTAYNAAKAANLIPNFPVATYVSGQLPQYPASANPDSTDPNGLCSYSSAVCNATDDIIDVPNGHVALSFDDGPQPPSATMLKFLQSKNLHALHFMIGSRIVDNAALFTQIYNNGDPIACHTWSHPYMTTLNDSAVVGELGWTLQIIFDKTGRLPAFWRPPYGDVDNRVRAIAKEVFGLKTVIWNQDTRDWCLSDLTPGKSACSPGDGPQTYSALVGELTAFYDLPHSPGLVILEHEHTTRGVQGFMQTYPLIAKNGWTACALPDCLNADWYQNAATDKDTPVALGANGVANANGTTVSGGGNSTATGSGAKATKSGAGRNAAAASSVVANANVAPSSASSSAPTAAATSTSAASSFLGRGTGSLAVFAAAVAALAL